MGDEKALSETKASSTNGHTCGNSSPQVLSHEPEKICAETDSRTGVKTSVPRLFSAKSKKLKSENHDSYFPADEKKPIPFSLVTVITDKGLHKKGWYTGCGAWEGLRILPSDTVIRWQYARENTISVSESRSKPKYTGKKNF